MKPPLLIAHRGGLARAPENSAAALRRALADGAAAVEIDARPTADELLIVLHDETPERLTGRAEPAAETPSRELIRQTYLERPSECLLLLDEALALLAGRTLIDLELKPDPSASPEALARRALEALERAGSPKRVLVTSESVELLEILRAHAPALETGLVFRSRDTRDPVAAARSAGAGVVVANASRIDPALAGAAKEAGLGLWAYTVGDLALALELLRLGVEGLVTNDEVALGQALAGASRTTGEPRPKPAAATPPETRPPVILALDLGSTSTKAALIDPRHGILIQHAAPTPTHRPGAGRVEHDAEEVLALQRRLIERLAADHPAPPRAAALVSQRSTGLWAAPGDLAPLTPALSWRDRRGEAAVAALEADRQRLEEAAGLPMAPAWTAFLGQALATATPLPAEALLLPLGSWIAARLTGSPAAVDPTLANRMFLLAREGTRYHPALLEAFGLSEHRLPALRPTIGDHGTLPWPGGGSVPLTVLGGDQQAAYVGGAGPAGSRVVLNVGTAGFAMRTGSAAERTPPGCRRAPLWTSASRPIPARFLFELPVLVAERASADEASWALTAAREIALGEPGPEEFVGALCDAAGRLAGGRHRSLLVAGGILSSPHLVHLLETRLELPMLRAREPELTLLGAARWAAAAAGLGWSIPPAGGVEPPRRLWL